MDSRCRGNDDGPAGMTDGDSGNDGRPTALPQISRSALPAQVLGEHSPRLGGFSIR